MNQTNSSRAHKAFLKLHGRHIKIILAPFLVGLMLVTLGLLGVVGYDLGWLDSGPMVDSQTGELTAPLMVYFWLGIAVLTAATLFHLGWNFLLGSQKGVISRSRLRTALADGDRLEATVKDRFAHSIYKRGALPLDVVVFELPGGREACFAAFSDRALAQLTPGDVVDVHWNAAVPEVAIPVELLPSP